MRSPKEPARDEIKKPKRKIVKQKDVKAGLTNPHVIIIKHENEKEKQRCGRDCLEEKSKVGFTACLIFSPFSNGIY